MLNINDKNSYTPDVIKFCANQTNIFKVWQTCNRPITSMLHHMNILVSIYFWGPHMFYAWKGLAEKILVWYIVARQLIILARYFNSQPPLRMQVSCQATWHNIRIHIYKFVIVVREILYLRHFFSSSFYMHFIWFCAPSRFNSCCKQITILDFIFIGKYR